MNIVEFKKVKREAELRVLEMVQQELDALNEMIGNEGMIDDVTIYMTEMTRMKDRCRKFKLSNVLFRIDLDG